VVLLLLVGGVGAYFSVAGGPRGPSVPPSPPMFAEAPPVLTGANSVDDLPWSVPHPLFDRLPYSVSGHAPGQDTWNLNRKTQRLTLNHRNPLLLQTGTTDRPRFTLEASIHQLPWTGGIGLYWGYREFPEAAALRKRNEAFASLQYIYLRQDPIPFLKPRPISYSVVRGVMRVGLDMRGELWIGRTEYARHPIPILAMTSEAKVLTLTVRNNHLQSATFAGIPLNDFREWESGVPVHEDFRSDGFGVLGFGHNATVDGFRYTSLTPPTGE
jgi:hypothetical protein